MTDKIKPTRVFYVDIGNLPRSKANEYLRQVKDIVMASDAYENIFIPNRNETRVEIFWPPGENDAVD